MPTRVKDKQRLCRECGEPIFWARTPGSGKWFRGRNATAKRLDTSASPDMFIGVVVPT